MFLHYFNLFYQLNFYYQYLLLNSSISFIFSIYFFNNWILKKENLKEKNNNRNHFRTKSDFSNSIRNKNIFYYIKVPL